MKSKKHMIEVYEHNAKHTHYALGFAYNGNIYAIIANKLKKSWLVWDNDAISRGGSLKLRFKLTQKQKSKLIKVAGCVKLGTAQEIFLKDNNLNKGEQFERYLAMNLIGTWQRNNTPWYKGSDIQFGSVGIQVKYEGATVVRMSAIKKFERES